MNEIDLKKEGFLTGGEFLDLLFAHKFRKKKKYKEKSSTEDSYEISPKKQRVSRICKKHKKLKTKHKEKRNKK